MVDLTLILVFGRLLTVDSNNYPVQQSWFQRSQKRNVQNVHVDRFPSHARKEVSLCHTSHHTPVYPTSCFPKEPVEHSIEQQRALLPVMPIYIARLLNGRKTR